MNSIISSYWKIFRLIFVLFSLYLVGDAFFRWDGFRYYASFSEFLPGLALASILWSIVAVLTAATVWLLLGICERFCLYKGWKFRMEHGLLFIGQFLVLGAILWISKRHFYPQVKAPFLNLTLFLGIIFAVLFLSWIFRNYAELWIRIIQERITPLVWLFVIITLFSVPMVGYHTWWNKVETVLSPIAAQPSVTNKNRPNIILLTFDALTARNMSLYGYNRETTPFISSWTKSASVFTKAQAESIITTPTTASLMTGKRLWTHQTYHLKGSKPVNSDTENLPLLLKNYGYHTSAFVVNPFASVKALGIENGFDVAPLPSQFHGPVSLFGNIDKLLYQLFGSRIRLHDWILQRDFILYKLLLKFSRDSHITAYPPDNAFKRMLWLLNDSSPSPFFAWIHLYPPHDPYLPPKPFIGTFNSSSELKTNKSQHRIKKRAERYNHMFKEFPAEISPLINTLRDRYDEFIRYCDKQFEYFFALLSKSPEFENTVIILSSDHGESFEHGFIQHSGLHLYEQVTHIPLIIREPHQKKGRVIDNVIEQIDIPATILDLADIPIPSWMEGRSLGQLMRGGELPQRPAFSMTLMRNPGHQHQISKGTIAVWEGDYKLIHYLDLEKNLLFNLRQDPEELHNLFDEETEISHRLLALIMDNLKMANTKMNN